VEDKRYVTCPKCNLGKMVPKPNEFLYYECNNSKCRENLSVFDILKIQNVLFPRHFSVNKTK